MGWRAYTVPNSCWGNPQPIHVTNRIEFCSAYPPPTDQALHWCRYTSVQIGGCFGPGGSSRDDYFGARQIPPGEPLCPNYSWDTTGTPLEVVGELRCLCVEGYSATRDKKECIRNVETDQTAEPKACKAEGLFGNPISVLRGSKVETVGLGISVAGGSLTLAYDSARHLPIVGVTAAGGTGSDLPVTVAAVFGDSWNSSFHKKLFLDRGLRVARVSRGNGRTVSFDGGPVFTGLWTAGASVNASLQTTNTGYTFIDQVSGTEEYFDTLGVLTGSTLKDGSSASFTYSDAATPVGTAPGAGYLLKVQDNLGRAIQFKYTSDGRVSQVTGPDGRATRMGYTPTGSLQTIVWPDDKVKTFLYELPTFPWALTGVVDENASRLSTFTWDSAGRAIATEHAGGVDRYGVDHTSAPEVEVADTYDELNNVRQNGFVNSGGPTPATP